MKPFGTTSDGLAVHIHTLENAQGMRAEIATYGGTIVRLLVPDRAGRLDDVVLGFDNVGDYQKHSPYFGCIIGRVGNRTARGRFTLDGKTYTLATNNDPAGVPCHLHGGLKGFDKVVWAAERTSVDGQPALRLTHVSKDGDEGYPGNLEVAVTYVLSDANELRIDYCAATDRATPVNLTNHSYFNLGGHGSGTILGHEVTIRAGRFTPVTPALIPTGAIAPVAGTPLDFTRPHTIGARIDADHEQLRLAGGYDHNWALDHGNGALDLAATAHDPVSGRTMEVLTTEPGLQFYTANFLDGTLRGKGGRAYPRRGAFCFETQHFPDSPNQPAFPSIILRPGNTYRSTTVYRFGVR